jgi:3-isopropylmalate/(R)-2-methylmalate dehydratase small subunit
VAVEAVAGREITIDLSAQTVTDGLANWSFAIEAEPKMMLLQGLDAIGLTLESDPQIEAWLAADRKARPWVYLEKAS